VVPKEVGMTWKQAFWDLFHLLKQMVLLMEAAEERQGRRKYDGWFKSFREQIDSLVNKLPKE